MDVASTPYDPGAGGVGGAGGGAVDGSPHQTRNLWGWTLVLNPDGTTTAWNKTKMLHSHGPPARAG
jgi:hypothetical protein